MNLLLYCNAFLPKVDGIVFRIKFFLDYIDINYPKINVILVTPNPNTFKKYKRFKIIIIDGIKLSKLIKLNCADYVYVSNLSKLYKSKSIIKNICITYNINLIHIYHGDALNLSIKIVANDLKIPVILSYHTNIIQYAKIFSSKLKYKILKFFHPIVFRFKKFDLILNVSKSNQDRLIKEKIFKKNYKFKLMPYVIDTNKFYPIKKNVKKNKLFTMLFVGRIEKEKNIDMIIEILKYLNNYELIIVGDGNYKNELKNKCNNYNVKLVGKIKNDELYKYYNLADVLINPSKTESLGFTTLESMACKTVVVGFDSQGTSNLIKHMNTGCLFKTKDELIKYINLLKNNKNLKIKLENNAYKFVIKYDVKNYVDTMIKYYNKEIKIKKEFNKSNNSILDKLIEFIIYLFVKIILFLYQI